MDALVTKGNCSRDVIEDCCSGDVLMKVDFLTIGSRQQNVKGHENIRFEPMETLGRLSS